MKLFRHDTVRPQVAAGENVPQKWKLAVSIFNKQWRMNDKESSSGLGEGLITLYLKKINILQNALHGQNGNESSGSIKCGEFLD
jgi:hypothetical protein